MARFEIVEEKEFVSSMDDEIQEYNGEPQIGETMICQVCNQPFQVDKTNLNAKWCSYDCASGG